jgi:hypothetical protein
LDKLGKSLMERVRDPTINGIRLLLSGEVATRDGRALHRALGSLGLQPDQYKILGRLLMDAVERTMYSFLGFFQGTHFHIIFRDRKGRQHNLSATSNWLAGELASESAWIAKFSRYKQGSDIEKLKGDGRFPESWQ